MRQAAPHTRTSDPSTAPARRSISRPPPVSEQLRALQRAADESRPVERQHLLQLKAAARPDALPRPVGAAQLVAWVNATSPVGGLSKELSEGVTRAVGSPGAKPAIPWLEPRIRAERPFDDTDIPALVDGEWSGLKPDVQNRLVEAEWKQKRIVTVREKRLKGYESEIKGLKQSLGACRREPTSSRS
jgi:hypothetical protein